MPIGVQDIWRCIERGRQLGVAPTESWFKVVARACAEVHSFYALREVLPALLEAGLPLSKAMLEAIIKACGFVKRFEYAWVSRPPALPFAVACEPA